MPSEVVAIVRAVTETKLDHRGEKRPKEDRFRDYLEVLKSGTGAARKGALVSFADQLDNVRGLIASETSGAGLLGRLNTAPDQKLRHLAELREAILPVLTPRMLEAYDVTVAALAQCVAAWHQRNG